MRYLVARVVLGTGYALRALARSLLKLIPVGGNVVSGAIAASGTYGIGKSAEAYFFAGEIKKPSEFKREYEELEPSLDQG